MTYKTILNHVTDNWNNYKPSISPSKQRPPVLNQPTHCLYIYLIHSIEEKTSNKNGKRKPFRLPPVQITMD